MSTVNSTRSDRVDKGLNILLILTTVVTLLTLVLLVVTTPRIFSSANNSEEVRRGNEIAACRSQWRTRVDDAMSQVLAKKSELDILTNEGLQASVAKDNDALLATTLEAPEKRDAVMTAVNNLTTAIDDYRAAVDKSIDDSDAFLTECRKIRGSN